MDVSSPHHSHAKDLPMRPTYRSLIAALFAATLLSAPALAAPSLPSADTVLSQARATATAEHKNILLIFSASWCGPCHMFEHFIDDPSNKPIIDKAFVVAHLDDGERPGDPNHADSPGAVALRAKLGGAKAGWPFILMLSPDGHPIVDSLRNPSAPGGDNIGYPSIPVEVAWFMHMLQVGAPNLTPQDTATLHAWLVAHPM